jgi:hypothetical protein
MAGQNIKCLIPAAIAAAVMTLASSNQNLFAAPAAGEAGVTTSTAVRYKVIDLTPEKYHICQAVGIFGNQIVGHGIAERGGSSVALLWTNSKAENVIELNPPGYALAFATGASGVQQVGYGRKNAVARLHALLWNGDPNSYVFTDLHPRGFMMSQAMGISGNQEIGNARTRGGNMHAVLWTGTAASCIDLNPAGFLRSFGTAIDSVEQAGYGFMDNGNAPHALLWNRTAASAVDLNPNGYFSSEALSLCGAEQTGWGIAADGRQHALLWTGSSASAVDLNPRGYAWSQAFGTNGIEQVGYGLIAGSMGDDALHPHALVWNGSAGSFTDLNQFLPSDYFQSQAFAIDQAGDIVGEAIDGTNRHRAIEWVPEIQSAAH